MPKCSCCKYIDIRLARGYCNECMSKFIESKTKYCVGCFNIKSLDSFRKVRKGIFGKNPTCTDCYNEKQKDLHVFLHTVLRNAKNHSKKRRKTRLITEPFDITLKYLKALFIKQNGKCALSGIKMNHHPT